MVRCIKYDQDRTLCHREKVDGVEVACHLMALVRKTFFPTQKEDKWL